MSTTQAHRSGSHSAVRVVRVTAARPVLLAVALLLVVVASLLLGSNAVSWGRVWAALLDPARDTQSVVWGSRVPRTVLGLLVGAGLGLAGAVMQGHTRNPLADPGIFGVSAGASVSIVIGIYLFDIRSVTGTMWMAFAGAIVATTVVFAVASSGRRSNREQGAGVPMAVAGMAVSAFFAAVTSMLVLRDTDALAGYRIWVVGSLSGRSLDGIGMVAAAAVVGAVLAGGNIGSLNAIALGTDVARGLGARLVRARLVGLGAVTLLTASAVALTGPIGFVGLTAPHLARALVGSDFRRLLPMSGLAGAVVLLSSDVVGRLIAGNSELAVGVVMSVLGGVVFVLVVRRHRLVAL